MAQELAKARLLTVDGYGHTALLNPRHGLRTGCRAVRNQTVSCDRGGRLYHRLQSGRGRAGHDGTFTAAHTVGTYVATMLAHGITRLLTFNDADFRRFAATSTWSLTTEGTVCRQDAGPFETKP